MLYAGQQSMRPQPERTEGRQLKYVWYAMYTIVHYCRKIKPWKAGEKQTTTTTTTPREMKRKKKGISGLLLGCVPE